MGFNSKRGVAALALAIMVYIYVQARRGGVAPPQRASLATLGRSFLDALIPLGLPAIIFGGILGGIVTPIAPEDEEPDPDTSDHLHYVREMLPSWQPAKVADPVQRARAVQRHAHDARLLGQRRIIFVSAVGRANGLTDISGSGEGMR